MRAENHPLFPLVVVADCWLQRLLVWTPGQTDLIKTVALLLMVADHISMLCGLDNDWLRLAGRGAFPLFGLVWAMNLARHPQIQQRPEPALDMGRGGAGRLDTGRAAPGPGQYSVCLCGQRTGTGDDAAARAAHVAALLMLVLAGCRFRREATGWRG
nr:IncF plasmid conjugative transfer pilin acetylase TraX [Citrobacter portucalensis]